MVPYNPETNKGEGRALGCDLARHQNRVSSARRWGLSTSRVGRRFTAMQRDYILWHPARSRRGTGRDAHQSVLCGVSSRCKAWKSKAAGSGATACCHKRTGK